MNVAGIAFSDMLKKKFYKQLEEEEKKRLGEMKAVSLTVLFHSCISILLLLSLLLLLLLLLLVKK